MPGDVRDVTIIIFLNEQGDSNSNPGRGCLHFTFCKYPWEWYESTNSPSSNVKIVGQQTGLFNLVLATSLRERKLWIQTC